MYAFVRVKQGLIKYKKNKIFNAKSAAKSAAKMAAMTLTDRIRVRQPAPLNKIVGK